MNDTNNISNAISIQLGNVFNKDQKKYRIYGEEVKQGLLEPCFFIKALKPSIRQVVGNRYFRMQSFDVHYFPEDKIEPEKEMYDIGDELFKVLEYIKYNDELLRGTNMTYENIDGVLHFFVDYNYYFMREKQNEDFIRNLEYSRGGKK